MKIKKSHFIGFSIFAVLFLLIAMIIKSSGFSNINDFITSALIVFGFIFAFFIYLSNQNLMSNTKLMNIINNMPDYLPFKHALKKYFEKLIKKDFKIIVLIRTLDEKNHEWVLNQISAYNNIMTDPSLSFDETSIEFLFVKKYTNDIYTLIKELNLEQHNYIIITGLSAIFRDAIMARNALPNEEKECIQIIGSLSSIQDKEIQKIIDSDDKIIRIFPPDYDEAKTAMSFIFSKIKNSICPNEKCSLHEEKHNVIIIHNGTYGSAISNQCSTYFDIEFLSLNISTSNQISPEALESAIGFHSFDFKHDNQLICDKTNANTFESLLCTQENTVNHFYIIGYEPNVSFMLNHIDKLLSEVPNLNFSLLFAGTCSMSSWKKRIKETLLQTTHLRNSIPNSVYYLQLHTIKNINCMQDNQTFQLDLKHYNPNDENLNVLLNEELEELFPKKHVYELSNLLESYLKNQNNYITTFSSDSIHIALYAIKNSTTLLNSKFKILHQDGRKTDILVNGDSINQYTVKMLN